MHQQKHERSRAIRPLTKEARVGRREQVAQLLNVSVRTVDYRIADGTIAASKFGGATLIPLDQPAIRAALGTE